MDLSSLSLVGDPDHREDTCSYGYDLIVTYNPALTDLLLHLPPSILGGQLYIYGNDSFVCDQDDLLSQTTLDCGTTRICENLGCGEDICPSYI